MAVLDYRGNGSTPGWVATGELVPDVRDVQVDVPFPAARWQRRYVWRCAASDFAASLVAFASAYLGRWGSEWNPRYLSLVVLFPVLWVVVVAALRGYEPRFLGVGSEEFRRVGRAAVALTALVTFTTYVVNYRLARGFILVILPLIGVLSLAGRYGLRKWLHRRRRDGQYMHRVVLVGQERSVLDLVDCLGQERYHGLHVVAACLPEPAHRSEFLEAGVAVVAGYGSVVRAVRLAEADTVAVLASGDLGSEELRRLAWQLEPTGADLLVAPSLVEVAGPRLSIRPVSGLPLLHVEQPSFSGGRRVFKAVFDRALALVGLVVLSPLLALIAVGIRIDSRGPAIFRQVRIGRGGRPFTLFKFRSMVREAEALRTDLQAHNDRDGLMFKMHQDPRVTRVGTWLRRYSLDELPQLYNVLRGHMSLVGPRPPLPEEVERYADDVRRRLLVHPGVTGLWQVSGRADLSWEESVRLDLRYVDNWSLAFDLQILWKTIRAVFAGRGAY